MEFIISIASLLISVIALYFTALPTYRKYMSKEEKILLTIADDKIEDSVVHLSVVYFNDAYRDVLIANSFIQLDNVDHAGYFTYENKLLAERWISPILLEGKKQAFVRLEYKFDWARTSQADVKLRVVTLYTNSHGKQCSDSFTCGRLYANERRCPVIEAYHIGHRLDSTERMYSMKI